MNIQTNKLPDNPQIEVVKSGKTGLFTNYIFKAIPLAFDESMSYYETLCGLLHYLKNTIIPTVNNNADAVSELQTLYEELRNYVDDYFTNLDVQEEINNKLDQMVTDGTLPEIIASYLNSKAVFGFDNVESMKNSTNLINGSYAETLGYYSKNDGGNALYKIRNITNDDVVDDAIIIALYDNTLIAELIHDNFNLKQLGCHGDGVTNDSLKLKHIFEDLVNNGDTIFVPKGIYLFNNEIVCNKTINVIGDIDTTYNMDYCVLYNTGSGGIKFTATSVNMENIDMKGVGNNNTGYGAKFTSSRAKIKNCSFGDFKNKTALYIGDTDIYHNVDMFYIDNVFCYRSGTGCEIGSPLNDNEHPELVDANAGTIISLSVQSNTTGLHLYNATVNNILSLHAESNTLGLKLENAFSNILIHPYMENTKDISFDSTSINNILFGTRKNGYIENMEGEGLHDNLILTNLLSKGLRNAWTYVNTQNFKIGKNGQAGYWDLIHDGSKAKLLYSQANGIVDLKNPTNIQRTEVDYIKINASSNSNINNCLTALGNIPQHDLPSGTLWTYSISNSIISNDSNWNFWISNITFGTTLNDGIISSIEVTSSGFNVKFYNTTESTITIPQTAYKIFAMKHYSL